MATYEVPKAPEVNEVNEINEVNEVFAALASPARRGLLRLLLSGTQTVSELAGHFDMQRPSVSEHLKVLKDAGLVSERRSGRQRYYQLEPQPLVDLKDWLHPYERFWRERVKALREVLNEPSNEPPNEPSNKPANEAPNKPANELANEPATQASDEPRDQEEE